MTIEKEQRQFCSGPKTSRPCLVTGSWVKLSIVMLQTAYIPLLHLQRCVELLASNCGSKQADYKEEKADNIGSHKSQNLCIFRNALPNEFTTKFAADNKEPTCLWDTQVKILVLQQGLAYLILLLRCR